ncbi:uncharacterized protein Bfra_006243 [Botrytis fragariae]|uniref:Uncharacterized protein n=1 Tax=Botrytis fragariae TaxID=1964551 RepID=A0A8H6B437_9HELO|nr:uncharacterized protein Bfra_006243 [Botrytis fragariae]KAF5879039.1 hypothetical protein Bfra_006243 [Botrytis fragariae]
MNDAKVLDIQFRTTTHDWYSHFLDRTMRIEYINLLDGTKNSGGLYPYRFSKTVHIGEESFSINYYFEDRRPSQDVFTKNILKEDPKLSHRSSPYVQWGPPPLVPQISGAYDCEEGLTMAPDSSKKVYGVILRDFENVKDKGELSFENELPLCQGVSGVNKAGNQMYIIALI